MGFGANTSKNHRPRAGALWKRKSKEKGEEFFSGKIEVTPDLEQRIKNAVADDKGRRQIDIVIFNNEKEPGTNFPDLNIFFSEKR